MNVDMYRPDVYALCKVVTGSTEKARTAMRRANRANLLPSDIKRILFVLNHVDALDDLLKDQQQIITDLFGESW